MASNPHRDHSSSPVVIDEKQQLYQRYWAHHLWVYRQVLVWFTRILTLQDRNILYLMAVYSATNAVLMLLMTIGQSPMFLLGLFFLTLSATHVFSVLSNTTSQFRLLSQWNDKDEELFKKICGRVAQAHVGILRMFQMLQEYRNNDPKKFYCVGILLAVVFSNIGYLIGDFVLLHALVNFILLVPLILHYKLHLHLVNQDWTQITHIVKNEVLSTLMADLQRFLQRFKASKRACTTGGHGGVQKPSNVDLQGEDTTPSRGTNESEVRARKIS